MGPARRQTLRNAPRSDPGPAGQKEARHCGAQLRPSELELGTNEVPGRGVGERVKRVRLLLPAAGRPSSAPCSLPAWREFSFFFLFFF